MREIHGEFSRRKEYVVSQADRDFEEERFRSIAQDVSQRQRTRIRHRHVKDVLSRITSARGIAQVQTNQELTDAWTSAVGALIARQTQVGPIRRGMLQVTVANSTVAQELGFQKSALIEKLKKLVPDAGIRDFRFRVGPVKPIK